MGRSTTSSYDAITKRVSPSSGYASESDMTAHDTCWDAVDRMGYLRNVSFADMNAVINAINPRGWSPVIDGDIVTQQCLFTNKFLGSL